MKNTSARGRGGRGGGGGKMMGIEEGSVQVVQHCPHVRTSRHLEWILQPCLPYSLLAALCLSISKQPLHESFLFNTCYRKECPFMSRALCGFGPGSLVRFTSSSLKPLTHSLLVYSEERSASTFHVSQQNKSKRFAKKLSG